MEEITLENTVLFALDNNIFISNIPGEVIFGELSLTSETFNQLKSFKIFCNDFALFYKILVNIIKFFFNGDACKEMIKQSDDTVYYWCGFNSVINNIQTKSIKIGKEVNNEIGFEIVLNKSEFINFVSAFKQNMLLSLQLNSDAFKLIKILTNDSIENIIQFNSDECFSEMYIKRYIKEKSLSYILKIQEQLKYYSHIIIIVHKLQFFDADLSKQREQLQNELLNRSST